MPIIDPAPIYTIPILGTDVMAENSTIVIDPTPIYTLSISGNDTIVQSSLSSASVVVTYTMRGKRVAAPNDLIYWYPTGASDPTGALAPAPVTEIVCLGSR